MRELAFKQTPKSGDWYVLGLVKYPVLGFAPDTKSLMYAKTYADRRDPLETPLAELVVLDADWSPTWWVAKSRITKPNKLWFEVYFPWYGGERHFATRAVSMRKARQNVMHRIGVELCNVAADLRGAPERAAKDALAAVVGKAFVPELLNVQLSLKN